MRPEPSPLSIIAPSLDIVRSRPTDAAHSEYAGIAKQSQHVLFDAILTPRAQIAFCIELRGFPFPTGWAKLQSPMHHLQSFRMQECARFSIILPIILRTWLQPDHVQNTYYDAVESTITRRLNLDPVDCIVQCYANIAKSNTVIMSLSMSAESRTRMDWYLKQNRKAFQRLCECASLSAMPAFRRGESLVLSAP